MRSISTGLIRFVSAAEVNGTGNIMRVAQAADPVILQQQVRTIFAEMVAIPGTDYLLSHLDLSGGGDGHTFVCTMEFVDDALTGSAGIEPEPDEIAIFFYMAAQSEALAAARASIRAPMAALFPAAGQVTVVQTLEAGAAKGVHVMGCVLCTVSAGG
jgi:hypothetical protein